MLLQPESGKDISNCTKDIRALLDTLPSANKTAIRYLFGMDGGGGGGGGGGGEEREERSSRGAVEEGRI